MEGSLIMAFTVESNDSQNYLIGANLFQKIHYNWLIQIKIYPVNCR